MVKKIKWVGTLSTTERNNIGLIQVRQNNVNSEVLGFNIIDGNGEPYDLKNRKVLFCTYFDKLAPVEQYAEVIENGQIVYTMNQHDMQKPVRINFAYFKILDEKDNLVDTTQNFSYDIMPSIESKCMNSEPYITRLEEVLDAFLQINTDAKKELEQIIIDFNQQVIEQQQNFDIWFESIREILESIDPDGVILNEIVDFRYSELLDKHFNRMKDRAKFWDEEFKSKYLNVKWFGAFGNGIADDTEAIQAAFDFARKHKSHSVIYFPPGKYITTKPIIMYTFQVNEPNGEHWWHGNAINIVGHQSGITEIIKINNSKTTSEQVDGDIKYIDIDTTILTVLVDTDNKITSTVKDGTGTSSGINTITLTNKSEKGYALKGNACQRANYLNLNVNSYYGFDSSLAFSSKFDNIVFNCREKALYVAAYGTSNHFDRLYAYNCKDPYYIRSTYSVIGSIYADNCTGTLFTLGAGGQTVNTLGCESVNADVIVSALGPVDIQSMYIFRPTKDTSKALFHVRGTINIGMLNVNETELLNKDVKTPLYEYPNRALNFSFNINNINYTYSFDNNGIENPKIVLNNDLTKMPDVDMSTFFSGSMGQFNLRKGYQQPFLGIRSQAGEYLKLPEGMPTKAIYLDNIDERRTSQGSVAYQPRYNTGDVLLFNSSQDTGVFAAVVSGNKGLENAVVDNTFNYVQVLLNGTTENRPSKPKLGMMFFDQTLGYPIFWKGEYWVDSSGKKV